MVLQVSMYQCQSHQVSKYLTSPPPPSEQFIESLGSSAERPRALWLCPLALVLQDPPSHSGCSRLGAGRAILTLIGVPTISLLIIHSQLLLMVYVASLLTCILPLGPWSFIVLSCFSRV